MVQFSEIQQKQIKEERKRKERREMLLAARSKIMNGIERNNNRSSERAIWELMQNARDLSNHAITKIMLSSDSITFFHKGEPFNLDTLSNLVKQQSTKKDDDDTTVGQYGTGFMSTHIFSKKVYISGDCRIECDDTCMYVPLPNGFCLDRSSNNEDEFIHEMDRELSIVEALIGEPGNTTPGEWTSFKYLLSSDKIEKISKQIETTSKLMPYVMAFNDRIAECSIDNLGNYISFKKECCNISIDSKGCKKIETKIHVRNENSEDDINVHSLESNDGKDIIIIPPLPIGFDDTSVIPSQFIFFPMLGTEKWGTNFIFHSSRLYPVEERNSFFIPKEDDNVKAKYTHNEQVLKEMINMLFAYYRSNSQEQCLPIDFAAIDFGYNGDDDVTKAFYDNLQRCFADEFAEWKMIPTRRGYLSIKKDFECRVLDEEIYLHIDDEKMKEYIPSIIKYIPSEYMMPNKDIIEWSKIVKKWAPETEEYYLTMEEICNNVAAEDASLYTLLRFIKDLGAKGTELLESCALIPNREGQLMKIGDLRNGENITDALYDIAKPILGEEKDKLINTKYAGLFASSLSAYTRSDLRNEIKSIIDDYRDQSLKHKYYGIDLVLLSDEVIKALIKYCSAFDTVSPTDYRARLLETICDLYDITFNPIFIPQIEDDKPDLYSTSFKFLVEHTIFMLSQQSTEWLKTEHHRELLYQFVEKCFDTEDEERLEDLRGWLKKYGIIPNQLDKLCKLDDDLRENKSIDEDLQELYKRIFDTDLKGFFVALDFAVLSQLQLSEYTPQEVGAEIEKHFEEELDKPRLQSKEILVILNHLDSGWADYFKHISIRREELYYKFGSDDDRSALFQIQMQGSDKLHRMAELIKSEHFDEIMERAEQLVVQAQERKQQFAFTYAIGKLLEDFTRNEISTELTCVYNKDENSIYADDVQCGQDIVIRYKDKPLYYIECKTKWNFNEPAHMSSLQMRQAVEKAGRYALCCIDCTNTTGCAISPNATKDEVIKSRTNILQHTYVHRNLNEVFGDILKPIISHEKEPFAEDKIRVNGDFSCNIPKKVFANGQPFNTFITDMLQYLRDAISN
ncbi:hypothetical protein [uncultured Rikenella sp.]|uniref:sacsin N-terminal ATP-binding-like domain-containing protein n=1 Tax=uncultured Rikenella sp. TaxID=368003 RepID=UPI002623EA8D|nr:hypothetical protein [uncultured Rikenella sp.]